MTFWKANNKGAITLQKSVTPIYLILPLYEVSVSDILLNKPFLGGYRIILYSKFYDDKESSTIYQIVTIYYITTLCKNQNGDL